MTFLDPFFDAAFGFLLNWPPLLAIAVVSFVISLLITLIYKWTTNQNEMKRLKDELAGYQKKMKELKNEPEKMMAVQKQAMALNMQYMRHSMKSTFITFIPILLIFGWMSANFAYEPLQPNQEFSITAAFQKEITGNVSIIAPEGLEIIGDTTKQINDGIATFTLKGKEGDYFVTIASNGQEVDKRVLITTGRKYAPVSENYKSDVFKTVTLGNAPLKVFWKLSWIWVYIILAIVFSTLLRKVMKIY
ncbi:MAG: EMC3/TMCO1 family protein [Candidatus Woesearchaeota archaeon]